MASDKGSLILSQEQWKSINWMSRNVIIDVLEDFGFACLETDTYDEVKQDLAECIQNGSISSMVLEDC